jgi:hypothetical protein
MLQTYNVTDEALAIFGHQSKLNLKSENGWNVWLDWISGLLPKLILPERWRWKLLRRRRMVGAVRFELSLRIAGFPEKPAIF